MPRVGAWSRERYRRGRTAYNVDDSEARWAVSADVEPCVLVYDVGGSHISAAVCFKEGLSAWTRWCEPICRRSRRARRSLKCLHSLGVKAAEGVDGVQGAELAMPGPFDYEKGISWMKHKMPYLYGVNVSEALAVRVRLEGKPGAVSE